MKAPAEGTLRRIATFLATFGIGVATYITIADSGGGSPVCIAGEPRLRNGRRKHLLARARRQHRRLRHRRLCRAARRALLRGDLARMAGFLASLVGFGYSVYLTYLELFKIEAICQWCVASAVLMTLLFAANAVRMLGYVGKPSRERQA